MMLLTSSGVYVTGRPDRGASSSPCNPCSLKRWSRLRTMRSLTCRRFCNLGWTQSLVCQPDNLGSFQFPCWHLSRMQQLFYGCVFFLREFSQSQSHVPSPLLALEIPF